MRYISHSKEEIQGMLQEMGLKNVAELFRGIPSDLLLKGNLPMADGQSELELERYFHDLVKMNTGVLEFSSFLGAGAYNHFTPSAIDALISRSEFFTAYTPYQPEVSQGTLQAIFEYQSMITMLTGMDVSNASMYDGATAVTEAVFMAHRLRKGTRTLVAKSLHPFYRQVLDTYVKNLGIELVEIPWGTDGRLDPVALAAELDDRTASVLVQSPNFFGVVEDLEALSATAHGKKALLIQAFTEAMSLPLLKPSGACGVDVVAGEGQSFGVPLSFGGPYLGIFATTSANLRQMPGRLVGATQDTEGRRGFVLTLSTREQHIRREKATSNICSNEGLCALMAAIFLSYAGRSGLRDVAEQNVSKAQYALNRLTSIPGVTRAFTGPIFNEFVLNLPVDPHDFARRCKDQAIVPGVPMKWFYTGMENAMLFCVTEMNTREQIDRLVDELMKEAVV